jgi:hypothetical protein
MAAMGTTKIGNAFLSSPRHEGEGLGVRVRYHLPFEHHPKVNHLAGHFCRMLVVTVHAVHENDLW